MELVIEVTSASPIGALGFKLLYTNVKFNSSGIRLIIFTSYTTTLILYFILTLVLGLIVI